MPSEVNCMHRFQYRTQLVWNVLVGYGCTLGVILGDGYEGIGVLGLYTGVGIGFYGGLENQLPVRDLRGHGP